MLSTVRNALGAPLRLLDDLGRQAEFYGKGVIWIPKAVKSYKTEQVRLIAEVGMSNGALAVIGGSSVITFFITLFAGVTGGLQSYDALANLQLEALGGFASAIINPRLLVPIIAGAALAATVGSGFTAQLGAMRVSEEIDALEVMGVRSLPYLVTTRLVAGMITIIPIFAMAMVGAWVGWKTTQVGFFGLSEGTFDHYMQTFMQWQDVLYSFAQAIGIAVVVISIHTYYGYTATGGPAGVGLAVGKAVRTSLIAVLTAELAISMALYADSDAFRITG
ncbi:ABC transporter permease [Pseudonocardia sp. HH130629-09]|uniref:ABC transporter permease n=1 Tax=Pseudonocardia sp. HH130629-09 TaxID=1641402 RepID=UPI0006CB1B89|nr:ABC transporter permease [Pseudonocardia sp. HH130629-09]ALE84873.1 ABC transporter permease [Pseudonocardia sp. HH130629-09]